MPELSSRWVEGAGGVRLHCKVAGQGRLVLFLLKDCCNGQPELCAPLIDDISKTCSTPGACCG